MNIHIAISWSPPPARQDSMLGRAQTQSLSRHRRQGNQISVFAIEWIVEYSSFE
jgi:hypothetical protein